MKFFECCAHNPISPKHSVYYCALLHMLVLGVCLLCENRSDRKEQPSSEPFVVEAAGEPLKFPCQLPLICTSETQTDLCG